MSNQLSHYDVQQVCLNGHQITDSYIGFSQDRQDFCNKCGEQTIHECPKCKKPIRGHYYELGIIIAGGSVAVPSHCHECGKPYPWTERKEKVVKAAESEGPSKPHVLIDKICSRFHLVAKQLRDRHDNRPTLDVADEYDVQDLLHSLLRIFFDDIRPEEWTPSYAGKTSRMDFLLKNESTVIEVKKTRSGLGAKEIGTQLIDDIERYKKHSDCKYLICFVYDPEGRIANPRGLESDLNRQEGKLKVKVLIVPKGY